MNNSVSLMAVKDASGSLPVCQPQVRADFGFEAGQAIGKTDLQLFPTPCAICSARANSKRCVCAREIEREETLPLAGGDRHFLAVRFPLFDDDGAITGLCFQATDITARKRAEESLRLAAMVFDRASEGVMVTDTEQCILTVNDAFHHPDRVPRKEVVGKKPSILRSEKRRPSSTSTCGTGQPPRRLAG
jgi:two-component system CheB/CheR fusion protein